MKKTILYALTALVVLAGCSREEERLFDLSASERSQKAMENAENILTGATNGWHMVYFANPEKKTSAHVQLQFAKDGQVSATQAKSAKKIVRDTASVWGVVNDICPILTFNTYNNVMHTWADPGTNGLGYEGDYEFLILEATPERVRLKGKKYGAYSVLYAMKEGEDIATLTTESDEILNDIFKSYNLLDYKDGETVYTIFNDEGILRFAQQGKLFEIEDPYTPVTGMPDGLHLMNTMTGEKNTNRHFTFKEDGLLHSESAVLTPTKQYVKNYLQLRGQGWTLDMSNTLPTGLEDIIKQVNEELCDMAGQTGKKRTSKILGLRLTYNEDYVFGEQVITYWMELKYTDKSTERGHVYYEFKADFTGEDIALTYVGPQIMEDHQAEIFLESVPTLKTLFETLNGTYQFKATTAINPAIGGTFERDNIVIQVTGTEK